MHRLSRKFQLISQAEICAFMSTRPRQGRKVSVGRNERREFFVGNWNRRTSAAAEVMPLSRTSSWPEVSCSTPASCLFTRRRKSLFPTARRRWPIPAWPPSIHFLRKRLSYYSPLPSPIRGLVDSLIPLQLRGHNSSNTARGCVLRATLTVKSRIGSVVMRCVY
jgi:hypothetical protein